MGIYGALEQGKFAFEHGVIGFSERDRVVLWFGRFGKGIGSRHTDAKGARMLSRSGVDCYAGFQ